MKGYRIDGWIVYKSIPAHPYYFGLWVAHKGDEEFTCKTLPEIRKEITRREKSKS